MDEFSFEDVSELGNGLQNEKNSNQNYQSHFVPITFEEKGNKQTMSKHTSFSLSKKSSFNGLLNFKERKLDPYKKYSTNINDYELISDIGGVDDISFLYLAKQKSTGEIIALKYTDLSLSPNFEFMQELIKTSHNCAMLRHNNILPYFLTFEENDRLWTVTLPMECGSCRSIMKNSFSEGFSESVVATILKEILKAMSYLHGKHLIHNDVQADNILIDYNGEIKMTGLRQLINLQQDGWVQSAAFLQVGDNIEWAAPEVMAQNANYCEKADIYSLGITALELAFNKTPFDNWPPLKILCSKLLYPCPAVKAPGKVFSHSFYDLVLRCVHRQPTKRPTVIELLEHPFIQRHAKGPQLIRDTVVKKLAKKL
ncbi:hypothetical protein HK099_008448 [Clydaea vesicula]|uniref:Protein kinase domain-containing protein n=1 Tax=Clydaea vesicula TaxID=447962 RepID=A0AAD5U8E9_9FUNG|nr:hypothetical protein HK099_008448 [Clydaea vesicula]